MEADNLTADVEKYCTCGPGAAQTVHGSWSGPPTRMRDFVIPGVDVGAGRVIGAGSFGRAPEAISSRILVRRFSWVIVR